jgi:hypothetical protein
MTLVDEMADASGQPRWGTTLKRQLLGTVHWREWRSLLNANRVLRFAERTVTLDSDGRFNKTDLNTGSGDTLETYYRIQTLRRGNIFYQPSEYKEFPISPGDVTFPNVWYERGSQIQVIPNDSSLSEAIVGVNHLPARADLLASDSSTVVFPEGYDLLLAYETAAMMFTKGGAETAAAADMRQMARVLREEMHQDQRISVLPMRMGAMDDPNDWGSVS